MNRTPDRSATTRRCRVSASVSAVRTVPMLPRSISPATATTIASPPVAGGRGGYTSFPVPDRPEITALMSAAADEAALRWLFTPDESLPGRPIDALREGHKTEVRRRAQVLGW